MWGEGEASERGEVGVPEVSTRLQHTQYRQADNNGHLAVAELVNFVLRGVVEVGEVNANDRLVDLEIAGALSAMVDEEIRSGPITKAARKAEKKAEQDLWQALESLDLKNAREAAKEVTKKEFFKRRGGGKLQIN